MCRNTHWKQAVFYLKDKLIICKDEMISGRLSCQPNKLNPRDLDFELWYSFKGEHCQAEETLQYRMR